MSYSMWIELHQEFRGHPKVRRLADALKCSRNEATGIIINLWLWTSQYSPSGSLKDYTPQDIADACLFEGEGLIEALLASHLLDKNRHGYAIHDWKKHGLRFLKAKRERDVRYRNNKHLEGNSAASKRRRNGALPNLTVPNLTVPEELQIVAGFSKAWEEWNAFRKEIRKPLKSMTAQKQLEMLSKVPDPVAVINQSITNGWQGLFELKGKTDGRTRTSSPPSQIARATFSHGPEEKKHLEEIGELIRKRRSQRSGAD